MVLASEGDGSREEPDRSWCRRARSERGQPGGRRRRGVEEGSLGRLRLGRPQVGPDTVADGGDVQLGSVLREARPGGDQRKLEVRLLLRHDQGRLHRSRSVRPEGHGEDEGGHRREAEGHRLRQVQRVHGSAVRPEGQVDGEEGADPQGAPGSLLDAVALEGCRSGRSRRSRLRVSGPERAGFRDLRERNPHSRIPFCA